MIGTYLYNEVADWIFQSSQKHIDKTKTNAALLLGSSELKNLLHFFWWDPTTEDTTAMLLLAWDNSLESSRFYSSSQAVKGDCYGHKEVGRWGLFERLS